MNSYSEVRRVREAMSASVGHDVRALIAKINARRPQALGRIINPGTDAEQCHASAPSIPRTTEDKSAPRE